MLTLYNLERQKIGITLICTLLGLLLPTTVQWVIAAINVLTIGVIHGANDLYILSKNTNTLKKGRFVYLFFIYTSFVSLMVFALYKLPQLALLLFILVSSFHFGEQQWHKSNFVNMAKLNMFYAAYGIFLFSLLFYTHQDVTVSIINDISGILLPSFVLMFILVASFAITFLFALLNLNQLKTQLFFQFCALFTLIILFSQTSLLWSFSVYFVLWHSIPSLKEQASILYPNEIRSIRKYIKLAFPYWTLSLIGFATALYFFKDNTASLLALFFSFLAAITVPHVGVIFWMHQKN